MITHIYVIPSTLLILVINSKSSSHKILRSIYGHRGNIRLKRQVLLVVTMYIQPFVNDLLVNMKHFFKVNNYVSVIDADMVN